VDPRAGLDAVKKRKKSYNAGNRTQPAAIRSHFVSSCAVYYVGTDNDMMWTCEVQCSV
jgi:hypothetical protein